MVAFSPDRPEKLRESVKKHALTYALYSDSELRAATAFGLAFQVDDTMQARLKGYGIDIEEASGKTHHLLPVPAAFVVDGGGVIRYVYANPDHTKRVDPEKLLAEAKEVASVRGIAVNQHP